MLLYKKETLDLLEALTLLKKVSESAFQSCNDTHFGQFTTDGFTKVFKNTTASVFETFGGVLWSISSNEIIVGFKRVGSITKNCELNGFEKIKKPFTANFANKNGIYEKLGYNELS